jgi:hypothetical protein
MMLPPKDAGRNRVGLRSRQKALEPTFNLRDLMHKMTGVDLTEVDGIAKRPRCKS